MAFHNSRGDWKGARQQAQANANYFGWPYVVFSDTSGNVCVERSGLGSIRDYHEVIHPETAMSDSIYTKAFFRTLRQRPFELTDVLIRWLRHLVETRQLGEEVVPGITRVSIDSRELKIAEVTVPLADLEECEEPFELLKERLKERYPKKVAE